MIQRWAELGSFLLQDEPIRFTSEQACVEHKIIQRATGTLKNLDLK